MNDILRPGWVVLTTGSRPEVLRRALDSIRLQDPSGPILVVANGTSVEVPDDVITLILDENVGIPGGREAGLRALPDVDVVFFLDDDAAYRDASVARRVLDVVAKDARVGVVTMGIRDAQGSSQRRYVPRIGSVGADTPGPVTYFSGASHAIRRTAFLDAGGYPAELFYGHEELDLSWRLIDRGWSIQYEPRAIVEHPSVPLGRMSSDRYAMLARNRVWVARRNLPRPLHVVHGLVWLAAAMVRLPDVRARVTYWRSWRTAWRDEVTRAPISWSTVFRLTRLGRPPVL